ncbi:MAG: bacillithiol biosynthesis cysteine-adding enzyme BshC [Gemmatimonadaceae bacterium]
MTDGGPRIISNALGGPALTRAAIAGTAPGGWYNTPHGIEAWRAHVARIRDEFAGRDWLPTLAPALGAADAAADRLASVAGGRGIVVTTGQQAGLFGGPIYTFSKAIGALALADALQDATGVPVAPVFWAATDDSDFAEASVTYVAVPGGLETLRLPAPALVERSMRDTPLADVRGMLHALERGAGSATFADALDAARATFAPGATIGGAYVALLRGLLEPLGIAVLDAGHPALRRAAYPTLRAALERAADVEGALVERDDAIVASGYGPQVSTVRGLSLVFSSDGGARRRIAIADAPGVLAAGERDDLGANVLLRPIVERAVLPTAGYCAGPGELAYFAQVSAVARAIGAATPVVVPRWSGTIVEPHIDRILERYAIGIDDLADAHAAETRLARERVPTSVQDALAEFRLQMLEATMDLRRALDAPDAGVSGKVADGYTYAMMRRLERLDRRIVAAVKRREDEMRHDIATARAALYPHGEPQERMLNFLPLLARHGPALVDRMRAAALAHARSLVTPSV